MSPPFQMQMLPWTAPRNARKCLSSLHHQQFPVVYSRPSSSSFYFAKGCNSATMVRKFSGNVGNATRVDAAGFMKDLRLWMQTPQWQRDSGQESDTPTTTTIESYESFVTQLQNKYNTSFSRPHLLRLFRREMNIAKRKSGAQLRRPLSRNDKLVIREHLFQASGIDTHRHSIAINSTSTTRNKSKRSRMVLNISRICHEIFVALSSTVPKQQIYHFVVREIHRMYRAQLPAQQKHEIESFVEKELQNQTSPIVKIGELCNKLEVSLPNPPPRAALYRILLNKVRIINRAHLRTQHALEIQTFVSNLAPDTPLLHNTSNLCDLFEQEHPSNRLSRDQTYHLMHKAVSNLERKPMSIKQRDIVRTAVRDNHVDSTLLNRLTVQTGLPEVQVAELIRSERLKHRTSPTKQDREHIFNYVSQCEKNQRNTRRLTTELHNQMPHLQRNQLYNLVRSSILKLDRHPVSHDVKDYVRRVLLEIPYFETTSAVSEQIMAVCDGMDSGALKESSFTRQRDCSLPLNTFVNPLPTHQIAHQISALSPDQLYRVITNEILKINRSLITDKHRETLQALMKAWEHNHSTRIKDLKRDQVASLIDTLHGSISLPRSCLVYLVNYMRKQA
uniref:Uncharacterized protein n=1 Tax=Percolomonas cosmopolitus TaxID=63605 RepID=A0A7S1PGE3_9EUKA